MDARRPVPVRYTLGDLAEDYVPGGSQKHQRDEKSHLLKALDEMKAQRFSPEDLRVSDIRALVDLHFHRPSTARHRHGALQRFLDELVEREIVEVNVAKSIKRRPTPPPPRTSKPNARDIQALWNTNLGGVRSRFLRAALLLPLRIGELAELTGENIDVERQAIVLYHLETKNGDPFALPIPDQALCLFPKPAIGQRLFQMNSRGGPMNSWSTLTKRIRTSSGATGFRFHDIRRAFVSELAEHNIGTVELLDGLLNHRQSETKGGVKAHYHQAGLWPQKVAALDAWGRLVEHAVEHGRWPREDGTNV